MTDPREALERLTRWRDEFGCSPARGDKGWAEFSADVSALLSLVEKQQEALTQFGDPRNWNANRNMWVRPDDPVKLAASPALETAP